MEIMDKTVYIVAIFIPFLKDLIPSLGDTIVFSEKLSNYEVILAVPRIFSLLTHSWK